MAAEAKGEEEEEVAVVLAVVSSQIVHGDELQHWRTGEVQRLLSGGNGGKENEQQRKLVVPLRAHAYSAAALCSGKLLLCSENSNGSNPSRLLPLYSISYSVLYGGSKSAECFTNIGGKNSFCY